MKPERNLVAIIDAIVAVAPDLQPHLADIREVTCYTAPELLPIRWCTVAACLNTHATEHPERKRIAEIFSGVPSSENRTGTLTFYSIMDEQSDDSRTALESAREIAAQCWCTPETEKTTFDPTLAKAFARQLSTWMELAALGDRNTAYYRGLLEQCGQAIGPRAFTSDDGTIQQDVLCAKIPEILEEDYSE